MPIRYLFTLVVLLMLFLASCSETKTTDATPNAGTSKKEASTSVHKHAAHQQKKKSSSPPTENDVALMEQQYRKAANAENTNLAMPKLIAKGNFSKAVLHPTTNNILFTDEKGNNIYLKKEGSETIELLLEGINIGNNYGWSKEGSKVFFREKQANYQTVVKSVNINTKEIAIHPEYDAFAELKAIQITDTIYTLDKKTLRIEAKYKNDKWVISGDEGRFYSILLAPDNKHLIAHKGSLMYLFTTKGELVTKICEGIATGWHPNSKKFVFFLDESIDGHQMSGSEIYIYDLEKDKFTQMTHSPEIFEMWPSFINENEIIFTDDVNNKVYTKNITSFYE